MKNKGFTLVELLAVIVILAILVTIAVPSTMSISKKIKENMFCEKISSIKNAASLYGEDRRESFTDTYDGYDSETITVEKLVSTGYLKKDTNESPYVVDPRDKNSEGLYRSSLVVYIKYDRIYVHFDDDAANSCVS